MFYTKYFIFFIISVFSFYTSSYLSGVLFKMEQTVCICWISVGIIIIVQYLNCYMELKYEFELF